MSAAEASADLLSDAEAVLAELIAFPTVSDRPNIEAVRWIGDALTAAGAEVEFLPDPTGRKANLVARFGPMAAGGVLLSGHIDVVPEGDRALWSADPFRMRRSGERLYGRGSVDMKGFLACVLASAPRFATAVLKRPVLFAVTYDEEVGFWGARALLEAWPAGAPRPSACIVGEPSGMVVVDAHKGSYDYTTRFIGRGGGHASTPPDGISPLSAAARFVAEIDAIAAEFRATTAAPTPFDPPWTTLQAGRISGGSGRNILPGDATVEWEIRPVRAQDGEAAKARLNRLIAETLTPEMRRAAPEARIETIVHGEGPALERVKANAAADLVESLLGRSERQAVSFGAEAGLFQQSGAPTVICGPGSILQAHIADEFIERSQLAACLGFFDRLADALAA